MPAGGTSSSSSSAFDVFLSGGASPASYGKEGGKEASKERENPTAKQQHGDEQRHQTPLGIMQEIPTPQPRFRLPAHDPLLALLIPSRREPGPEMVDEVLDDVARLGDGDGRAARRGGGDGDDGGFAEGVHALQVRWGEHLLPLEGVEVVVEVELFEEPEDALGAGLFEPAIGGVRVDCIFSFSCRHFVLEGSFCLCENPRYRSHDE